jgi:medium-chain acyl-[acyl-carrier-protein] hydrolase
MPIEERSDLWFPNLGRNPSARLRLFCFPYAGGNAAMFRKWQSRFPRDIEVCPVELPGHGRRLGEPAFTSVRLMLDALMNVISRRLDKPFALYGHSMGATIAFELARELLIERDLSPTHLFVSARRAPQIPNSDPPTHNLPETDFIEELRRLEGTPPEVFQSEELLGLMMPLLRSDFELVETYNYISGRPLSCPITAMGGIDDKDVTREQLQAWCEVSSGKFLLRMFAGNHFFVYPAEAVVISAVIKELQSIDCF